MSDRPADLVASVPAATAKVAQEHDAGGAAANGPTRAAAFACTIDPGVPRAARVCPYDRKRDDPIYRPLRIFTLDPAQPRLEGATALVDVPYEPLEPGPVGRLFEVDNRDRVRRVAYTRVDLDEHRTLIENGRAPSPSDVRFHQQMVYAVASSVYAAFKAALGRNVAWGFDGPPDGGASDDGDATTRPLRLRLVPHAMFEENAYYAREHGEIVFGYYRAGADIDAKNPPGGFLFTCLSHDIVAHELSHALLDGLRGHFVIPTRRDVLAFHEGFADLVAIFQHFTYEGVVAAALKEHQGSLERSDLLAGLARQFGFTTLSKKRALRTAIECPTASAPRQYGDAKETHELGSVLVSAVFEAFTTLFRRKTERYFRLATNGSGVLGPGALPSELQRILAEEASQLASQILACCIRAIDYCPPVDLELGDYLRAIITADAELVADDPWAYREALVDAFGRRGIFPSELRNLAEDSLRWRPPWQPIKIPALHFANLQFAGDPALAASPKNLRLQAAALAEIVACPRYMDAFGIATPDGDAIPPPSINSIRTARRVGPDGQVLFDLVAEVTQTQRVALDDGRSVPFYGGATVIVDPEGVVRYVIVKNLRNPRRQAEFRQFMSTNADVFWSEHTPGAPLAPRAQPFRLVHWLRGTAAGR